MEVQKIERGMYLTHALIEEDKEKDIQRILGIEDGWVNCGANLDRSNYYWGEVIHEGNAYMIWRKGILLCNVTAEELSALQKQSRINLSCDSCSCFMSAEEDAVVMKYSHE